MNIANDHFYAEIERLEKENAQWRQANHDNIRLRLEVAIAIERIDAINDNPANFVPEIDVICRALKEKLGIAR